MLRFFDAVHRNYPAVKFSQLLAASLFVISSLVGILLLLFDASGVLAFGVLYLSLAFYLIVDKFEIWQFVDEVKEIRRSNARVQERFLQEIQNKSYRLRSMYVDDLFGVFEREKGRIQSVKNTAYYTATGTRYFNDLTGAIVDLVVNQGVTWRECVPNEERAELIAKAVRGAGGDPSGFVAYRIPEGTDLHQPLWFEVVLIHLKDAENLTVFYEGRDPNDHYNAPCFIVESNEVYALFEHYYHSIEEMSSLIVSGENGRF